MDSSIAESYRRFNIPCAAEVVTGNGGLLKIRVTNPDASGEMYLHGAHVTSWKPAGREEVLFLSSQSRWEDGAAIRGGVPVCFPWFGEKASHPEAPGHGFVRTLDWQLESIAQVGSGVTVSMFTESNEGTKKWWPADFRLEHRATFGSELSLELVLTNTGSTALRFEEALHTYFEVGDVEKVQVRGLNSVQYADKTDSYRKKVQQGAVVLASETDRVYLNTSDALDLEDTVLHRRIGIQRGNSNVCVVWNPWAQKAISIPDLANDEWKRMLCVETCNVADFAVDLASGQQHTMKAVFSVADLRS